MTLKGSQRAAILLVALGPELAGRIYGELQDNEIDRLTLEIAWLSQVDPEDRTKVMDQFVEDTMARGFLGSGGLAYARELLESSFGPIRAEQVMKRLAQSLDIRPFSALQRVGASQINGYLQHEHPQTIALILSHLDSGVAAAVLEMLPQDVQADVVTRMARLDRINPDLVKEVERVVERKLSNVVPEGDGLGGGVEPVAEMLNQVDRQTERSILKALAMTDEPLAEEIKAKMFVFEDLVSLDDRSLQRLLREVDMQKEMPLALKGASEEVRDRIYHNLSGRAADDLKEAIEYLGPVRLRDVETAQQHMVMLVRRLEDAGEIVISHGGEDQYVV